jgi:hypothetical protein
VSKSAAKFENFGKISRLGEFLINRLVKISKITLGNPILNILPNKNSLRNLEALFKNSVNCGI